MLAICAHFTLYEYKREKALLALKVVLSYSGNNQFSVFLPVLQDYNIEKKIKAIVANNAPTNNTLYRTIEKHI